MIVIIEYYTEGGLPITWSTPLSTRKVNMSKKAIIAAILSKVCLGGIVVQLNTIQYNDAY